AISIKHLRSNPIRHVDS
ncbi:phosphotransferase system, EIIC family protein, partial [Vibrio parahaemolyticus V-223/04]